LKTYDKKLNKRLAKGVDDVVDFDIELVAFEQRPPPRKDGVGHFEDPNVDFGVRPREPVHEILSLWSVDGEAQSSALLGRKFEPGLRYPIAAKSRSQR
jgi:hypothetical protein